MLVHDGEQVTVWGWSGLAGLALLLVMAGRDTGDPAEPVDAVLASPEAMLVEQFVAEEPVAERGVVLMDVVEDIDEMCVIPVPLRYGTL